ncbi:hypothetical protein CVM73_18890 [Bradyrhizobium forestalis]|uniref:Uncharacterized protein n=1 Tax=Bradyrhizobium forestalis TaxID=1419263 RepID=A0A2M8R7I9_9BRAD|nr:hypothetical protein CVM73_18890 [Bradyrhizobium forestalis]
MEPQTGGQRQHFQQSNGALLERVTIGQPELLCTRFVQRSFHWIARIAIFNFIRDCECIFQVANDLTSFLRFVLPE